MSRKNTVLRSQSRHIVYNVYNFMKKEAEEGLQVNLRSVNKRTATSTGISDRTVRNIITGVKKPGSLLASALRTPGKKRSGKKKVTGLDDFNQGVIKRCIHKFYITNKEVPSVEKILSKLQKENIFKGSSTSLRRVLKNQGFSWKRMQNNKKIMIEKTELRLKRIEYLNAIEQYRQEGRPIVFTGEFYANVNNPEPNTTQNKSTNKICERVMIIHAGSETGFVPNALFMKTSTDNKDMNYEDYEQWVRNVLIPNLSPYSVIVLGNAPYHNVTFDDPPNSISRKSEMESWLRERGISYSSTMLKPQLYNLISLQKEKFKKYKIDQLLKEHNQTVLRLPPFHSDLNAIELVWAEIRQYVAENNTDDADRIMMLVREKVEILESDWSDLCGKIKEVEEDYRISDHVIDRLTEDIIIDDDIESVSGSEMSESDEDSVSDSSEDDVSMSDHFSHTIVC